MRNLIELTPEKYRCAFAAACPAVLKSEDGKYYVIGNSVETEDTPLEGRVADHELAIEISAELLEGAVEAVLKQREAESA